MEDETTQWNSKIEEVISEIASVSGSHKNTHIHIANLASSRYNKLTISGIIIGPLTGIFSGLSTKDCSSELGLNALVISLGLISGIIVSMIKFCKFEEVYSSNKRAASTYSSIENDVKRQLLLDKKDRVKAKSYLEWIQTKFDDTFKNSPLLPDESYQEKIRKKTENKNIKSETEEIELEISDICNRPRCDTLLEYEHTRMFNTNI